LNGLSFIWLAVDIVFNKPLTGKRRDLWRCGAIIKLIAFSNCDLRSAVVGPANATLDRQQPQIIQAAYFMFPPHRARMISLQY
jgi:hypothetical protein